MRKTNLDDIPVLFETLKEMTKDAYNIENSISCLIDEIIKGKGRIIDKDNFIIYSTDEQYYEDMWSVYSFDVTIEEIIYSDIENAKKMINRVLEEVTERYINHEIPTSVGKANCCGMYVYYHLPELHKEDFREKISLFEPFDFDKIKDSICADVESYAMRKWMVNMDYYEKKGE